MLFAGTSTGEYDGAPPTGRDVRVPFSMFLDVQDGSITGIRVCYSPDRLVQQLRGDALTA